MRHFSEYEKEIIKLIVEMNPRDSDELSCFGVMASGKLFPSGQSALFIPNDADNKGRCILLCKKDSPLKSHFIKITDVLALVKYLEDQGLIYLCEQKNSNDLSHFFYEDAGEIEKKSKYTWTFRCKNSEQYTINRWYPSVNKHDCLYIYSLKKSDGRELLSGEELMINLHDSLIRVLCSAICPTHGLMELVDNNFITLEEKLHKEQMRQSRCIAIKNITTAYIIAILPYLIGNCCGKTTFNEERYEGQKSAIITSNEEEAPEAVCPACNASGKLAPDSINQEGEK